MRSVIKGKRSDRCSYSDTRKLRHNRNVIFQDDALIVHIKIGALSLVVPIFCACAPIPNYAFVSPAVIGKVHRNGIPIENAIVYVEHPRHENCSFNSEVLTRTNNAGEFHFEPRKEFQFFVFMDPVHNWQICIADGDSGYQGWYQHGIGRLAGIGRPAPEITLDCNLENKAHVKQIGNSFGKTMGVCNASWKYN